MFLATKRLVLRHVRFAVGGPKVDSIPSSSHNYELKTVFRDLLLGWRNVENKDWFPLGVDCRLRNSLFLYLVLCACIKLNRETKNFLACNLRLMETSLMI